MLSKEEIGKNLRLFAKNKGYTLSYIAEYLGMKLQSFQNYYDGTSVPGGEILARLGELGCDINWLLNGTRAGSLIDEIFSDTYIREKKVTYYESLDRFDKLEKRINDIEKQNAELINFCASLIGILKQNISDKDELIQRLSVQFVSLVAANRTQDNLNSGNNIIK